MEQTNTTVVTLDTPIKRGDTQIASVTVRKPLGGALRGASTRRLLDMETDDLVTVLPRITDPVLTAADIHQMDGADLLQLGGAVAGFLLPKAVLQQAAEQTAQDSPTT
ncbi:MAG: phage tail assembly protein [Rhodocyclales bacterium]|nr:phage tail assembly protein [Rhodocyclales bacterium]